MPLDALHELPSDGTALACLAADIGQLQEVRERAWEQLFPVIEGIARQVASRFRGSLDDELATESAAIIWMRIQRFQPECGRFEDWCRTVLYHHAIEAYDLLALWPKLRRIRPELIEQLGGMEASARVAAVFTARGTELASQALAECLLTDLDDTTLVLYAAGWLGVEDRELESGLEPCLRWLAENAELFLPAAVHVQAVGMALRPDLPEFDYGLAVTALKYLDILRATRVAEEELALADVPQLDPADARRLAARCQQQRVAAARVAFLSVLAVKLRERMRRVPFARAGEAGPQAPLLWWVWSSPAGDMTARLTIPPEPVADERVMLEFLDAAQQRATGVAGQTATLHGVQTIVDPSGKATFLLRQLLESDEPLLLQVGPKQIEWMLSETNMEQ
jgi:hypothetical protein